MEKEEGFLSKLGEDNERHFRENSEGQGKEGKVLASTMFKIMCIA